MINLLSESAYIAQTNKIKSAITNKVNEIKNSLARIGTKLGATINWLDDVETALNDDLMAINTELVEKGSSQADDFSEVAEKISDIQTGITPKGQIAITENGAYDVTDYASASVDVAGFDVEITTEIFATDTNIFNINNPREEKMPYGLIIRQTSVPEGTVSRVIFVCMFKDLSNHTCGGMTGFNSNGAYVYNSVGNTRPANYRDYASIGLTGAYLNNATANFIGTYECKWLYEREGAEE